MRCVIQRVSEAYVTVEGKETGRVERDIAPSSAWKAAIRKRMPYTWRGRSPNCAFLKMKTRK